MDRKPGLVTMTTRTAHEDEAVRASGADADPYAAALQVFRLVKQHDTPPFPNTYALWFAYVLKTNPGIVAEIQQKTQRGETISAYDINELCETFLTKEDVTTRTAKLTSDLHLGLSQALKFFERGAAEGSAYAERVDEISRSLQKEEADPVALVRTLIEENDRMSATSRALNESLARTRDQIEGLSAELIAIREEGARDALTGIANRRAFDRQLQVDVKAAINGRTSLCLAMADLDHFKAVNDRYGHLAGDTVLRSFADLLSKNVKGKDTPARYGGEEFAVILPETSVFDAHNLMTSIRHKFSKLSLVGEQSGAVISGLTASFGIAVLKDLDNPKDLLARADKALYAAKRAGRNTVCTEGFTRNAA